MPELSPASRKLILHWGEMGAKWGINRTVAQVHMLLYLSPESLNAEDISKALRVARSNVSTSLRELQGWGIVRTVHQLGDRRDYFESLDDVWEIFRIILQERKKREADPTVAVLRESAAEFNKTDTTAFEKERIKSMLDFFETMTELYLQLNSLPTDRLVQFARMGRKIPTVLLGAGGSKKKN